MGDITGSKSTDQFICPGNWDVTKRIPSFFEWNPQMTPLSIIIYIYILPIGSMYGIYANIWGILMVHVTIYSIHGSYGLHRCNTIIYIIHIIIYYNDIVFGIPTFRFHVNDCHFGDPGVTFVEQDPALWTALGGFVMFTGTKNLMIYSDLHGDVVEKCRKTPWKTPCSWYEPWSILTIWLMVIPSIIRILMSWLL